MPLTEIESQLEKLKNELDHSFFLLTTSIDIVQVSDYYDAEDENFCKTLFSQYAYKGSDVCARMRVKNVSLYIRTSCHPDEIYECYPVDSNRAVLYVTAKGIYQMMKRSKNYSDLFAEIDKLMLAILNEKLTRYDDYPMDTMKQRKQAAMDRFYSDSKVSKILK